MICINIICITCILCCIAETQESRPTLEKDDRVFITLRLGTLHSSIQMVGDPREYLRDVLRIALLQLVFKEAEHLVVLCQGKGRER